MKTVGDFATAPPAVGAIHDGEVVGICVDPPAASRKCMIDRLLLIRAPCIYLQSPAEALVRIDIRLVKIKVLIGNRIGRG